VDWKQVLEIASPVTVIFMAGVLWQQIKTLREETRDFRSMAQEWRAVLVRLEAVERTSSKSVSDIKELGRNLGKTLEEMISGHMEGA
jgi:hypothetical protein